jgi:ABC-type nitrate/sulfonate/bicarbonate transport system substrate-binding protein
VSKGLPIALMMSRANYLMIRPELEGKLRRPADLKGRTVAVAARGAILVYELAKILEAGGLTLADVELKYIPFGQMATALTTGAVDAALMISPLQDQVAAKGIGIKWINADRMIKAQPVLVSAWQANTDWMRQNEDAARKFVLATLRGVRDYCAAYHRGPNRDEVTRILVKYSDVKDPALIDRIEWGATRCRRAHLRGERRRHPEYLPQGAARLRPGAAREDRAGRLARRGGCEPRTIPSPARRRHARVSVRVSARSVFGCAFAHERCRPRGSGDPWCPKPRSLEYGSPLSRG